MRIVVDPPSSQWQPRSKADRPCAIGSATGDGRTALAASVNRHAQKLGTGRLEQLDRILATGHQAWLWHPGILAKDLAMTVAAPRLNAGTLHLVVDQDVHEALTLSVPVLCQDRLRVETVTLAHTEAAVPSGCQPPADAEQARRTLVDLRQRLGGDLAADVGPILQAFTGLPPCQTLAQQVTLVLARLWQPYADNLPVVFATDLAQLPGYRELVQRMFQEAQPCVAAYNRAVAEHPEGGVAPLRVEPLRVELPLWCLRWRQPRQRVFADLADRQPLLTLEDGQPLDLQRDLIAPRALMLTALVRSCCCDLFIHGKGGGVYDCITSQWWRQWLGQDLSPIVVVSADLTLPLDAPLAQPGDLDRALWWAHHLPHNLDRALPLDGPIAREKRSLLAHMDDDRQPARRALAFARIHQINEQLTKAHPQAVAEAQQTVDRTRAGLANRRVVAKRDWCFALYPPEALHRLRDELVRQM